MSPKDNPGPQAVVIEVHRKTITPPPLKSPKIINDCQPIITN
jgi:hypothetical protein